MKKDSSFTVSEMNKIADTPMKPNDIQVHVARNATMNLTNISENESRQSKLNQTLKANQLPKLESQGRLAGNVSTVSRARAGS